MVILNLVVYDDADAARKGQAAEVQFSIETMTPSQAEIAIPFLQRFTHKLEEYVALNKYGKGEIIPEPGDDQKTASQSWTDKDSEELAEENAETDQKPEGDEG